MYIKIPNETPMESRPVELSDGAQVWILPAGIASRPADKSFWGLAVPLDGQISNIFGNSPENVSEVMDHLVVVDDPGSSCHGTICYDPEEISEQEIQSREEAGW